MPAGVSAVDGGAGRASSRLVILDRDGVINEDSPAYIKSAHEWQPLPGSLEAMARLSHAGYRVVIASNQSGLARGLLDMDSFAAISRKMEYALAELGGRVEGIFFCPHAPEEGCTCRKPAPGLLQQVGRRFQTGLDDVCFVGDKLSDVQAALNAGAKPVLVRTGEGLETEKLLSLEQGGVPVFDDLAAFVDRLLAAERQADAGS